MQERISTTMLTELKYAREIQDPIRFGPSSNEPKPRKFRIDRENYQLVDLTKVMVARTFLAYVTESYSNGNDYGIATVDYDRAVMFELVMPDGVIVHTPYTVALHAMLCPSPLRELSGRNSLPMQEEEKKECCCGREQ
jgi:hypothetical protein